MNELDRLDGAFAKLCESVAELMDAARELKLVGQDAQPSLSLESLGLEATLPKAKPPLPGVEVAVSATTPRVSIWVANGQQGQSYRSEIQLEPPAVVQSVEGLEELGVRFEKGVLVGCPIEAGEHAFRLRLEGQDRPVEATLIVNPDPRSLWREVEPSDPSFAKPHTAYQAIEGAEADLLAASRRGRSHAHGGAYREDDFSVLRHPSGWWVMAVSDGAGSARYSRLGSKLVCENAVAALTELMDRGWGRKLPSSESDRAQLERAWAGQLADAMKQATFTALLERAESEGFLPTDLCATLLLVAARPFPGNREWLVMTFGVGDGAVGAVGKEQARLLSNPDSGVFAGQTKFTIMEEVWTDAVDRCALHVLPAPQVLLAMTDGVSDPKFASAKAMQSMEPWLVLYDEIGSALRSSTPEAQAQQLVEWLNFFHAGEHDDRTLALLRPRSGDA